MLYFIWKEPYSDGNELMINCARKFYTTSIFKNLSLVAMFVNDMLMHGTWTIKQLFSRSNFSFFLYSVFIFLVSKIFYLPKSLIEINQPTWTCSPKFCWSTNKNHPYLTNTLIIQGYTLSSCSLLANLGCRVPLPWTSGMTCQTILSSVLCFFWNILSFLSLHNKYNALAIVILYTCILLFFPFMFFTAHRTSSCQFILCLCIPCHPNSFLHTFSA